MVIQKPTGELIVQSSIVIKNLTKVQHLGHLFRHSRGKSIDWIWLDLKDIFVCIYVCVYIDTYLFTYTYVYTYMCIYIYICSASLSHSDSIFVPVPAPRLPSSIALRSGRLWQIAILGPFVALRTGPVSHNFGHDHFLQRSAVHLGFVQRPTRQQP